MTECCRQANRDAREASQVERLPVVPLKNPIQRLAPRVLEYEDHPTTILSPSQHDLEILDNGSEGESEASQDRSHHAAIDPECGTGCLGRATVTLFR